MTLRKCVFYLVAILITLNVALAEEATKQDSHDSSFPDLFHIPSGERQFSFEGTFPLFPGFNAFQNAFKPFAQFFGIGSSDSSSEATTAAASRRKRSPEDENSNQNSHLFSYSFSARPEISLQNPEKKNPFGNFPQFPDFGSFPGFQNPFAGFQNFFSGLRNPNQQPLDPFSQFFGGRDSKGNSDTTAAATRSKRSPEDENSNQNGHVSSYSFSARPEINLQNPGEKNPLGNFPQFPGFGSFPGFQNPFSGFQNFFSGLRNPNQQPLNPFSQFFGGRDSKGNSDTTAAATRRKRSPEDENSNENGHVFSYSFSARPEISLQNPGEKNPFGNFPQFPGFGSFPGFLNPFSGFQNFFSGLRNPNQQPLNTFSQFFGGRDSKDNSDTTRDSKNNEGGPMTRQKRSPGDDSHNARDESDRNRDQAPQEAEDHQNRLFFSSLFTTRFVTCDYTTQAGSSCSDCTTALTCFPSNVGRQRSCVGFFPYCNNGRCSFIPGSQCFSSSSTTTASSSTTPSSSTSTAASTTTTPSSASNTTTPEPSG